MKPPLLIFLIVVFTLTSFTQIYTIPDAEQQPAWVFPLWFEDGTGARDTIYFAYDEYAIDFGIPSADVVFGEDLLPLNLDTFNVFWDEIIIGKAHKVVVFKTITAPIIISFLNAHLPLKITWDNNLFYSNMLPFANNFPLPNAWGSVHCGFSNDFDGCAPTLEGAIVITDAPDNDFWNNFATDSLWFNSDFYEFFDNYLDFQILSYSDVHNWGQVNFNSQEIEIAPTVTHSLININFCCCQNVFVTNLWGITLKAFDNIPPGTFTINISDLPSGLYLLSVRGDNLNLTTKILKL